MTDSLLRVLLIEDNEGDARLLKELVRELKSPRLEVTHVSRLYEGLPRLQAGDFDLVLLDLSLPDASGVATVERTHRAAPGVPIVVMTGLADEAAAADAMRAGAQDYLVKGEVTAGLLSRAIRYALDRAEAEQARSRLVAERTARAAAEAATARWRLLAEFGDVLGGHIDLKHSLNSALRCLVPSLGDACAVDFLDDDVVERAALAAVDPETGLYADSGDKLPPGERLVVPIDGHAHSFGSLTLVRATGATWTVDEKELARECARRIAMAKEAEALFRARENVLGVVGHDLRNPLNVIAVSLPLLEGPASGEARAKHVMRVRRALQTIDRLISDLLDVTRLDQSTLPMTRQTLDVGAFARDAFEQLRPLSEERSLEFTLDCAPTVPAVLADRERLLQVISNLVGNATKFTPPGGRVTLGAAADGDAVRFWVDDTGPGIAPDELPRVFDRFWQGKSGGRSGAGLGLAIARGIVVSHGGRIGVDSKLGKGTTFWFTLPACAPARPAVAAVHTAA